MPPLLQTGVVLLALMAAQLASGQTMAAESARMATREASRSQRLAVVPMRETVNQQRFAAATMRQATAKQRVTATRIKVSPSTFGESFKLLPRWPILPAGGPGSAGALCEPLSPDQLNPMLERVSAVHGLDPDLVRAVVNQESGFRPCAVSAKGAVGLMQLMPATIEELEVQDAFDPEQNIDAGTRLLRQLLVRYGGDLALALAAYNAGPTRVDDAKGVPPISETIQYVSDLLKRLTQRAPAPVAPDSR